MASLKIPVTSKDHIRGNPKAPITLLEYGDLQCPFCGKAYPVLEEVFKKFGNSISFVFRHFPLKELHPYAEMAAETTEFASSQNRFWEAHDLIFKHQFELSDSFLIQLVESMGLSGQKLLSALEAGTYTSVVKESFLGGVRSGVNGTPTLFINEQRYNGPVEVSELVHFIEAQQFGAPQGPSAADI